MILMIEICSLLTCFTYTIEKYQSMDCEITVILPQKNA